MKSPLRSAHLLKIGSRLSLLPACLLAAGLLSFLPLLSGLGGAGEASGAVRVQNTEGSEGAGVSDAAARDATPLESVLNTDGTLNLASGFNGSVDPAGWRMVSQSGGPPRF